MDAVADTYYEIKPYRTFLWPSQKIIPAPKDAINSYQERRNSAYIQSYLLKNGAKLPQLDMGGRDIRVQNLANHTSLNSDGDCCSQIYSAALIFRQAGQQSEGVICGFKS